MTKTNLDPPKAVIGVLVGHLSSHSLGGVLIGAIAGFALGWSSYQLISVRILKSAPTTS
ncbi:MAG TPA: hypothetical protein VJH94_03775 [Candidatus Paceibacterota bacterium]